MEEKVLLELGRIYVTELGKGPFPTTEVKIAGKGKLLEEFHGCLTLYLAEIAGIASRGQRLATISATERDRFLKIAELPFFARYPQFNYAEAPISAGETPALKRLLDATDRARKLILQALS